MNVFSAVPTNVTRRLTPITGAYYKIFYAPIQDIDFNSMVLKDILPDRRTGIIDYVLYGAFSEAFRSFSLPNQRKTYIEEPQDSDAGTFIRTRVGGYVPFPSIADILNIEMIQQNKHILVIQFCTGSYKILGAKDDGVKFLHTEDRGESSGEVAGISFSFEWISPGKPLILTQFENSGTWTPPSS